MRNEPEHALHGYDGRVVYADTLTAAVYARLTPSMRDEVRHMVETEWSGALELKREDMGGIDVVGGEFRISDCVARVRLDFGGNEDAPEVVLAHDRTTLASVLPDTLLMGLKRRDLADVVGHEVARGIRIICAEAEDGHTVIRHAQDAAYLVDIMCTPYEKRASKKREA